MDLNCIKPDAQLQTVATLAFREELSLLQLLDGS